MSLGLVIKAPEGLVLAAESRVTLTATQLGSNQQINVNYDNATKLMALNKPHRHVGVVTYGLAAIGQEGRTAYSFIPEFEATLGTERLSVLDLAQRLSNFFMEQWKTLMPADYKGVDMTFIIGGFSGNEAYGRVYEVAIPSKPTPIEYQGGKGEFGLTWGGQREFVDRLIQGYDNRALQLISNELGLQSDQASKLQQVLGTFQMPLPLAAMPLQDCVDLGIFLIRTTIDAQRLTFGIRGCGGPIDVAIITRNEGLRFVQRKQIMGEKGTPAFQEDT